MIDSDSDPDRIRKVLAACGQPSDAACLAELPGWTDAAEAFRRLQATVPELEAALRMLRLCGSADRIEAEAARLSSPAFFYLLSLGEPVDRLVSNFSGRHYRALYPDIRNLKIPPHEHYIRFGFAQGKRKIFKAVRDAVHCNDRRSLKHAKIAAVVTDRPCSIEAQEIIRHLTEALAARGLASVHLCPASMFRQNPPALPIGEATIRIDNAKHALEILLDAEPCIAFPVDVSEAGTIAHLDALDVPVVEVRTQPPEPSLPDLVPSKAWRSSAVFFMNRRIARSWELRHRDLGTAPGFTFSPETYVSAARLDFLSSAQRPEAGSSGSARDRAIPAGFVLGAGSLDEGSGFEEFRMLARFAERTGSTHRFLWCCSGIDTGDPANGAAGPSNLETWHHPTGLRLLLGKARAFVDLSTAQRRNEALILAGSSGCPVIAWGERDDLEPLFRRFGLGHGLHCAERGDIVGLLALIDGCGPVRSDPVAIRSDDARLLARRIAGKSDDLLGNAARDFAIRQIGHPSVWVNVNDLKASLGRSGNVVHRMMEVREGVFGICTKSAPFCVHYHVHDVDAAFIEDFHDLAGSLALAQKLVFTTTGIGKQRQLEELASGFRGRVSTRVVPNLGRDILPFVTELARDLAEDPDMWWCHVHNKKSHHSIHGEGWRRRLLQRLLPSPDGDPDGPFLTLDQADCGLVAPLDRLGRSWRLSHRLVARASADFRAMVPQEPLMFPVGNMFFCRARVALAMAKAFDGMRLWPEEPIPRDGTVYHLMERLWPTAAARCGLRSVFYGDP